MTANVRDQIRQATVGQAKQFKKEVVTYNGVNVEIRQPSIQDRRALYKKCTGSDGELDFMDFLVWAVIYNTYVPDTNEKVFEEADYDSLIACPTGSFVDQFGEKIAGLMNVTSEEVKGKSES